MKGGVFMGRLKKNTETECAVCGIKMMTYKHVVTQNLPTYCSNECRKLKYKNTCHSCGNTFRCSKKDTKTCSPECQTELRRSNMIEVTCSECGEKFKQSSFNVYEGKNSFCSKRCGNRYHSKLNPTRYGGKWSTCRENILNRDQNTCLKCGNTEDLQVHHFIPIILFKNPNAAHYQENLGTFCKNCHRDIEGEYESLSEFEKDIVRTCVKA